MKSLDKKLKETIETGLPIGSQMQPLARKILRSMNEIPKKRQVHHQVEQEPYPLHQQKQRSLSA